MRKEMSDDPHLDFDITAMSNHSTQEPVADNDERFVRRVPTGDARIFVTSADRHINPAREVAEWGTELITLLPDSQVGTHLLPTSEATTRAAQVLEDFDAEKDFLLLIGDPVKIGICAAIVAARSPRFTMLRYDRMWSRYYPIEVDLNLQTRKRTPALLRKEPKSNV